MTQKRVRVFSTPTCVYCHTLKQFLKEENILFEDIDVSRDRDALEEMVQKSGQLGVPVTEIDDEIVVGFNKERISGLLDIK